MSKIELSETKLVLTKYQMRNIMKIEYEMRIASTACVRTQAQNHKFAHRGNVPQPLNK